MGMIRTWCDSTKCLGARNAVCKEWERARIPWQRYKSQSHYFLHAWIFSRNDPDAKINSCVAIA